MGFSFLLNLLSTLPGTVVYNLLVFLGLLASAGIVLTEWRHSRNPDLVPYLIAFGGTMVVHMAVVVLAPLHLEAESVFAVISAPLLYAGELLSILLLLWAFGQHHWRSRRRVLLSWLFLGWGVLLVVMSILWYRVAFHMPLTYSAHSWQVPMWYILSALAAFAAVFLLLYVGNGDRVILVAFFLLGVGSVSGALGSQTLGKPLLVGEGFGRLLFMLGYPLFAISLYSSSLIDLDTYRRDLQDLSQEALRQSQELLFLIEATRSIGEGFDVRGIVSQVADNIAMALRAHTVIILLADGEKSGVLSVGASYQVLGWKSKIPSEIVVKDFPVLAGALRDKTQVLVGAEDDSTQVHPIFELLGLPGGSLLAQPLIRKGHLMGLLVACNDNTKPAFTYEQGLLATTIGVQIAAAIENTKLYQSVQTKAEELSQLLQVREAELLREEAILESMAEGILVSDAHGYFTLMNHAAEEILDVGRRDVLGRNAQDSFESSAFSIGFDPDAFVGLDKPLESTFNLDERRIRVHAAPVLAKGGNRLGVVSILQDITREYLAEQSKREFIASISHELRTPLTAIKGYTEVMLSGMAGALPPAFAQFLGVIRENTTRMTSLTNNIISVAEIEQGRVGLNYQSVDVPDLINELLSRYQERVEERMLSVKVDFPEDLPTIEVDQNRLRLILDNLLNNAVKFTYPSGRITIGCRGIQGTLGKPTFFSIWVSDTGVGIPVEEQNRIWERFHRVENSLSLEAGGLGIGLTIARALVEAHGGRVWVDSTLDEGSTFTVLLPIYRSQGAVAELDLELFW